MCSRRDYPPYEENDMERPNPNARWLLNPDRGWRNGRFGYLAWVGHTVRDLARLVIGRHWYDRSP